MERVLLWLPEEVDEETCRFAGPIHPPLAEAPPHGGRGVACDRAHPALHGVPPGKPAIQNRTGPRDQPRGGGQRHTGEPAAPVHRAPQAQAHGGHLRTGAPLSSGAHMDGACKAPRYIEPLQREPHGPAAPVEACGKPTHAMRRRCLDCHALMLRGRRKCLKCGRTFQPGCGRTHMCAECANANHAREEVGMSCWVLPPQRFARSPQE